MRPTIGTKLTGCPGWLDLSEDRLSVVLLPERAEIVRRIFQDAISGIGGYTIAKRLNAARVPPFPPSKDWQPSNIHNLLRNRATIGEFQPRRKVNGKRIADGEPIKGFYPAVIDEQLFEAAQHARSRNLVDQRGRKGDGVTNLFSGLAKCAVCGGRIGIEHLPGLNDVRRNLICQNALRGETCTSGRCDYSDFERAFLAFVGAIDQAGDLSARSLRPLIQNLKRRDAYKARRSLAAELKRTVAGLTIGITSLRAYFTIEFTAGQRWSHYLKDKSPA